MRFPASLACSRPALLFALGQLEQSLTGTPRFLTRAYDLLNRLFRQHFYNHRKPLAITDMWQESTDEFKAVFRLLWSDFLGLRQFGRGSIIVTSNLPFDEWTGVFASERLTGALLDRLTHHVHILELNGDSFRLKHSKWAFGPPARQ